MRFCTFVPKGEPPSTARAGIVKEDRVFDLTRRATLTELLGSPGLLRKAKCAGGGHPLAGVKLSAPVPRPGKIIATIVNTQGMLGEGTSVLTGRGSI